MVYGADGSNDATLHPTLESLARLNDLGRYLYLRSGRPTAGSTRFQELGVHTVEFDEQTAEVLKGFCAESLARPFSHESVAPGYVAGLDVSDSHVVGLLNGENFYYDPPPRDSEAHKALAGLLRSIAPIIEEQLACSVRVTNVRAWSVRPGAAVGPNAWHCDGLSPLIRKVLIYPNPPNPENGTLEIVLRNGRSTQLSAHRPTLALADIGNLMHRGVPSAAGRCRPVIEVTLIPWPWTEMEPVYAGQNARIPRLEAGDLVGMLAQAAGSDGAAGVHAVNIGGGPSFSAPGWLNIDGAPGPGNLAPTDLNEQFTLGCADGSIDLVYSSHCLEHLDDATVDRVLGEARRVLGRNGALLLKLPDFDRALASWRTRDPGFFQGKWGLEDLVPLWRRRGLDYTLDAAAAMVFCGFWNEAYGDHFSRKVHMEHPDAYHGPPVLSDRELYELARACSPHQLAARLRAGVLSKEKAVRFNHQNAWSRGELSVLLERHGFVPLCWDAEPLCRRYAHVPDIRAMQDISLYCLAGPAA